MSRIRDKFRVDQLTDEQLFIEDKLITIITRIQEEYEAEEYSPITEAGRVKIMTALKDISEFQQYVRERAASYIADLRFSMSATEQRERQALNSMDVTYSFIKSPMVEYDRDVAREIEQALKDNNIPDKQARIVSGMLLSNQVPYTKVEKQ